MKRKKLFLLAAAFVLVGGLCASAMAQDTMSPKGLPLWLPPEPILPIVKVNAIENRRHYWLRQSNEKGNRFRLQLPGPDYWFLAWLIHSVH